MLAGSSLKDVAQAFDPGVGVPGLPGWEYIPTPGHTPSHVSFFRPGDRVLITGDAVVTLKLDAVPRLLLQRPRSLGVGCTPAQARAPRAGADGRRRRERAHRAHGPNRDQLSNVMEVWTEHHAERGAEHTAL